MKKFRKCAAIIAAGMLCMVTSVSSVKALDLSGRCVIEPGDCNLDGRFDSFDVTFLQHWLIGSDINIDLYAADMNYDNRVNVIDLSLMKAALIDSYNTYSYVTYTSKDQQYTMKFSITTDFSGRSDVKVTWYDPDGDIEKYDGFTVISGNPFTEDGEWVDDITFTNNSSYSIIWNESSVTIDFGDTVGNEDVITRRAVVLDYPDRTRTLQTGTYEVDYPEAPEITRVQLSAMCYGQFQQKCEIEESRNWLSENTVGRVGAPVTIEVDDSIESYDVTLYYDEDELRWVPEENLIVLAYDEAAPVQVFIKVPDAVFDYENNTISFTGDRDCDFILADGYKWNEKSSYDAGSILDYVSDWEREGNTGDIMSLADKQWFKENFESGTIEVSSPEELASAVYYANALESADSRLFNDSSITKISLANDIDLSGFSWASMLTFSGELDGQGHSIRNMSIDKKNGSGFIECTERAYIHDISFENATVSGDSSAGIAAASADTIGKTRFVNVNVSGNITAGSYCRYGAIMGVGKGSFTDCSADVTVNGTEKLEALSYDQYQLNKQMTEGEELVALTVDLSAKTITRTADESISDYTLCIVRNNEVILSRDFSDETVINMEDIEKYTLQPGSYHMYVTIYRSTGYERISNVVSYVIE